MQQGWDIAGGTGRKRPYPGLHTARYSQSGGETCSLICGAHNFFCQSVETLFCSFSLIFTGFPLLGQIYTHQVKISQLKEK